MTNPTNRALVPISSSLPALRQRQGRSRAVDTTPDTPRADFGLVQRETYLRNNEDIEKYLPDILGRALARIWIDPHFRDKFALEPKETLAEYGVYLPQKIQIDFVTEGAPRPMIVVYEQKAPGAPRRRLLHLRLTMLAGR